MRQVSTGAYILSPLLQQQQHVLTTSRFDKETHMVQVSFVHQGLRFPVNRNLLTANSPFLERHVDAQVTARLEKPCIVVNLSHKNNNAECFNYHVHWLYKREIATQPKRELRDEAAKRGTPEYLTLAKLYLLGRLLEDAVFRDAVLDTLVARITADRTSFSTNRYLAETTTCIYDDTLTGDKAREFLVVVWHVLRRRWSCRVYGAKSWQSSGRMWRLRWLGSERRRILLC